MKICELRKGNLVTYKACAYMVVGVNAFDNETLTIKAVNKEWDVKPCHINELEPMPITKDILKRYGFSIVNKNIPELWVKPLGGYRYKYIRYYIGVQHLDFETTFNFIRFPWTVRYVHQLQNACTDYNVPLEENEVKQITPTTKK